MRRIPLSLVVEYPTLSYPKHLYRFHESWPKFSGTLIFLTSALHSSGNMFFFFPISPKARDGETKSTEQGVNPLLLFRVQSISLLIDE
jgi:hypothetical protein